MTIDKGASEGIVAGLPVISGSGIVGQVIKVGSHSARVLLIIDRASGVDVMVQSSRARGILQGVGSSPCDFQYVSEAEHVENGEKVVTSGMDGVFPKGLNVGVVSAASSTSTGLFHPMKVSPAVVFSRLEDVLVLLEPGEAPVPTPVATKASKEKSKK